MRLVKIIFGVILTILGIVFVIQNLEPLTRKVQFKFGLYFYTLSSMAIPLWVLVLFSFFLGVFTTTTYCFVAHLRQRQIIRKLRADLEAWAPAESQVAESAAPPRNE